MSARPHLPHRRALDGVRGVAVLAVLLFHAGRLDGGYLGVDLFFVLSGYLITSLLLVEAEGTGTIGLLGFWARRARRLLPALFLVLAAVGLYAALVAQPSELERIRADALATLAYVANWRFVFGHYDYFALFTSPSPLNHTWSLAIEEQFYLVWPLVVTGMLRWRPRAVGDAAAPDHRLARQIFALALGLAGASAVLALVLWVRGHDTTRIYYGTDTRAAAILLGAALGAFTVWRGPAHDHRTRVAVEAAAFIGAGVLALAWWRLDGENLYRGGLLICGVAATAVVAAAAQPRPGPLARVLSVRPFVGLGIISYGVYLWHWPIYVWLDADRVGLTGWPLVAVRIAVTLVVAVGSFVLVERPIRRGAFAPPTLRWATPLAAGLLIAVTLFTTTRYSSPVSAATGGLTDAAIAARRADAIPGARRLMVVGNSVGYYLAGEGFEHLRATPPLVTLNAALPSCNYPAGERIRVDDFSAGRASFGCDQGWAASAGRFHPDAVLMTFSDTGPSQILHDGRWLAPCDAGYRDWYLGALDRAVDRLGATGGHVVMTTAPYSEIFGASEDRADETDCTNALTRAYTRAHPTVGLVDVARMICPSHTHCRHTRGGVSPLRSDGVHFRGPAAVVMARTLFPKLGLGATRAGTS